MHEIPLNLLQLFRILAALHEQFVMKPPLCDIC